MKILSAACSRRDILRMATSSTLVTVLSSLSIGCSPGKADLDAVAKKMVDILNHPIDARKIGTAHLARLPINQHQSTEQLTRELLHIIKLDPDNVSVDSLQSFDARLSAQVRQDFIDENVVIVDNWMLSKTELMLCLLAAVST
jgi:hypothetical protein